MNSAKNSEKIKLLYDLNSRDTEQSSEIYSDKINNYKEINFENSAKGFQNEERLALEEIKSSENENIDQSEFEEVNEIISKNFNHNLQKK